MTRFLCLHCTSYEPWWNHVYILSVHLYMCNRMDAFSDRLSVNFWFFLLRSYWLSCVIIIVNDLSLTVLPCKWWVVCLLVWVLAFDHFCWIVLCSYSQSMCVFVKMCTFYHKIIPVLLPETKKVWYTCIKNHINFAYLSCLELLSEANCCFVWIMVFLCVQWVWPW